MRIVLEEPLHGDGRGGVSVYNRRLLEELPVLDPANEYRLFTWFFGRPELRRRLQPPEGAKWKAWTPRWPERAVRFAEWKLRLPWIETYLAKCGVRLYHAHRVPVTKKVPLVTTVYDLFPVVHPAWNSAWMIELWEQVVRPGLDRVERIMAISSSTKRDLIERWNVPEERIEVILWGVDRERFRELDGETLREVAGKYALPERFFLMVGPFDPWCDPLPSLKAWAALPQALRDTKVVMAGPKGACHEAAARFLTEKGLADQVLWLGHVPQEDLVGLYNLAQGLLFASLYEGFGLPVLEAMACGTPVITSTTSSLPEVAGGAALLADPEDVSALGDAMRRVLEDSQLREELKTKGLARAADLSWRKTAQKTLKVYRSVLG